MQYLRYALLALGILLVFPYRGANLDESLASFSSSLARLTRQLEDSQAPVPVMSAEDIVKTLGEDKILAKDMTRRIWQLKALPQKGLECQWQGGRNTVCGGLICSSPKERIVELYQVMVNQSLYDAYADQACALSGSKRLEAGDEGASLVGRAFFAHNYAGLPIGGSKLVPATLSKYLKSGYLKDNRRYAPSIRQCVEKVVEKGPVLDEQEVIDAASWNTFETNLSSSGFDKQSARLAASSTGLLCIQMHSGTGSDRGHAVTLIVHKYEGVYSYFLIDSLNGHLLGGVNNQLFELVRRFLEDPDQRLLRAAALRSLASWVPTTIASAREVFLQADRLDEFSVKKHLAILSGYPKMLRDAGFASLSIWPKYKKYFLETVGAMVEEVCLKSANAGIKEALGKNLRDFQGL